MSIINPGNAPGALTGAACENAKRAEIHQSMQQGNVMRIEPVKSLALPPGKTIMLSPGGYHVYDARTEQEAQAR
jgi:copper(I)-binding protein